MKTWIVHRITKDKRCSGGTRWQPIGWVCHENEEQAKTEAHKAFRNFDQEELKLLVTTPGIGFLV